MNEFNSTDEKIIAATFRILQRDGYTKATTKRISKEAEVNEVTIFRNFQNKKNLIEITKEYYIQILIEKLEGIFDYTGDEEIAEYLQNNFRGVLNLSDDDFSIVKVSMEDVSDAPEKQQLLSRITDVVLEKMDAFFASQIEKGKIRDVDSRVLAVMCYSMTFQSVFLWKVYDKKHTPEADEFGRNFLDILYNGIKI